jgi:hypothetical protein
MRDLSNGRGSGLPCVPRTPPAERCDMSDQRDAEDRTESSENADPMENADMKEPTDPTDRAEPTDPIDSTDPLDPIDRIDPSDHRDHFDVCGSDSVMTAIVPGGILRHRTRGLFTLPPNDTDAYLGAARTTAEPLPVPFGGAAGAAGRREPLLRRMMRQHSMTLTARPPRAVSLYLTFMSAPVSRIVLMALSSDT